MGEWRDARAHHGSGDETVAVVLGPSQDRDDPAWPGLSLMGALNLMEAPGFDVLSAPEATMLAAVSELLHGGHPTVVVSGIVTLGGTPWLLDDLAADPTTNAAGRVLLCVDPAADVTWIRVDRSSVDVTMRVPLSLGYSKANRAVLRRAALLRTSHLT